MVIFTGCQQSKITEEKAAEIVKSFLQSNNSQEFINTIINLDNLTVEKVKFDNNNDYPVEFVNNQDFSSHVNNLKGKKVWKITYNTPLVKSDGSLRIYIDFYSGEICGYDIISPYDYNDELFDEGIFMADGYGCDRLLPGSKEIYPAIYFNGQKFYWARLPVREEWHIIHDGELLGDIVFVGDEEPTEDLQFTAKFYASGVAYYYEKDPDYIYVCMSTDWFTDKYTIFDKNYYSGLE